jgi:hypothetical protein
MRRPRIDVGSTAYYGKSATTLRSCWAKLLILLCVEIMYDCWLYDFISRSRCQINHTYLGGLGNSVYSQWYVKWFISTSVKSISQIDQSNRSVKSTLNWLSFDSLGSLLWLSLGSLLALSWLSLGSLLALYWLSIGSLLALSWLSLGSLLARYWLSIGSLWALLALYWLSIGSPLALHWLSLGSLLALSWLSLGSLLTLYWLSMGSIGSLLALYWLSIGSLLALYWLSIGSLLALYWLSIDSLLALFIGSLLAVLTPYSLCLHSTSVKSISHISHLYRVGKDLTVYITNICIANCFQHSSKVVWRSGLCPDLHTNVKYSAPRVRISVRSLFLLGSNYCDRHPQGSPK